MASLTINWTDLNDSAIQDRTDEDNINVYRSTSPFTSTSLPAILTTLAANTTTYTDTTVVDETTYYYMVSAVKGSIEKFSDLIPALATQYVGASLNKNISTVDYKITYFFRSGNLVLTSNTTVDYLIIGGGAGGQPTANGNGGGAGSILTGSIALTTGLHKIIVGAGGVAVAAGLDGLDGTNSSLGESLIATGGVNDNGNLSLGGVGASGATVNTSTGGDGIQSDITGDNTYYGGGGGASNTTGGPGGLGGGGVGASTSPTSDPGDGNAFMGSGGGGGVTSLGFGTNGSKGLAIIRYTI